MTVTLSASSPQLSRVRTFLFGEVALVWFGEMLFTGIAFDAHQGELALLSVSTLAAGSDLTALATATWFATAHSRSNRTLRQIVSHSGWNCSTSPVLIPFVPLLVG